MHHPGLYTHIERHLTQTGPDAFTSKVHSHGGAMKMPSGQTFNMPETDIVNVSRRVGPCNRVIIRFLNDAGGDEVFRSGGGPGRRRPPAGDRDARKHTMNLNDNLPEVLQTVRTRKLFVMRLDVRNPQILGATPGAFRRIGVIPGGVFEGERLSGEVLEGGSDWQTVRSDRAMTLNVRLVLKTTDGALIGMTYQGLRHGPPDIMAQIDKGEVVDPASYYFRINPMFETAAPNYDWINRMIAVGIGHRPAGGPIYSVFEVL